ncbi:MAG TPA: Uma2 family endonuclease [Thermoanaerobaculia bacterium]|nr:Uma2 family endonuclease [Thermoanaerobaculia bacterium]
MSRPWRLHRYTYAEYVALERVSADKHEFLDGEIYTMAGGSEDHSALQVAILALLFNGVRPPCRVHGSELRIYVEAHRLAAFPDGSVICGPLQQHAPSPNATALNPSVVVEVTSDSSEEYDCSVKRECYSSIPTLREYVIISHRERRVMVDIRNPDGSWSLSNAARGEQFELPSLQLKIDVDDVYRQSTIP